MKPTKKTKKKKIKYLVYPGIIVSKNDGDRHYIGADKLMKLYGVNPQECKIIDTPISAHGLKLEEYIVLSPNTAGDYSLPKK